MTRLEAFATLLSGVAISAFVGILTGLTPGLLRPTRVAAAVSFLLCALLFYWAGLRAGEAARAREAHGFSKEGAAYGRGASRLSMAGLVAGAVACALLAADLMTTAK